MNYEKMWTDLKKHLETGAESIEKSIGDRQAPLYTEKVDEIYRAIQEDIIREGKKSKLRFIRNVLTVMESMEEGYR